ncbi:Mitotic checkpoint protein BUB3, partial [Fragariocoptes setiger]
MDEYQLNNPPTDTIQSVKFSPHNGRHLLVASWDSAVRLYDVESNIVKARYNHSEPVLDIAYEGSEAFWSGSVDKTVKRYDISTQTATTVGSHTDAVRCVEHIPDLNLMVSGGWDSQLKFWDPRQGKGAALSSQIVDKVHTLDVAGHRVLVGTASRRVIIWDARTHKFVQRESPLKYQTRCIRAFPDGQGYVLSSIEGRVAVEYLDPDPEVQKQKYAFKCHRNKDPEGEMVVIYPVNAVSFHRKHGTFATGGSDGYVNIWDAQRKKRLVQFRKYPTTISSLSFSCDGTMIAIASSYLYENEEINELGIIPPDAIYIRRVSDNETKPK